MEAIKTPIVLGDKRCVYCPAALACVTGFIESFSVCHVCERTLASLCLNEMRIPDINWDSFDFEIYVSTWCPMATITSEIVCSECCKKGHLPF